MRVLLVDIERSLPETFVGELAKRGCEVDVSRDATDATGRACWIAYEAIIIHFDAVESVVRLCHGLRRCCRATPIVGVGCRSNTTDRLALIDAGADTCMSSPVEHDELLARVRALVRRGSSCVNRLLKFDDLELNIDVRKARRGSVEVELSNREFALLEYMMNNCERPLGRGELATGAWRAAKEPASNVVEVCMSNLRKKLDHGFERRLFHTVKGAGYKFGRGD